LAPSCSWPTTSQVKSAQADCRDTEKIQFYKTNQKLRNHENQLHQFRSREYHVTSHCQLRINDSGPKYATLSTVRIQEWSAAYYAQAESGKGTLYYHGGRHHFTISGGGVGGSGAQKVSATGRV
jgi:hypothetical protein